MIPESYYPELTKLISQLPQLFQHSEVIGVFLGNEICASIMHNASLLKKIRFYDNLSFTSDNTVKQEFLKLYSEWQTQIPNLEVLPIDGRNFDTSATFVYHDMPMTLGEFYQLYSDTLTNKLLANCGFGTVLYHTIECSRYITHKLIFPVLLYRDIIFYTIDQPTQLIYHNMIHTALIASDLEFEIQEYADISDTDAKLVLRLLTTQSYQSRAAEFLENKKNDT
jgi:hypothetical protein